MENLKDLEELVCKLEKESNKEKQVEKLQEILKDFDYIAKLDCIIDLQLS